MTEPVANAPAPAEPPVAAPPPSPAVAALAAPPPEPASLKMPGKDAKPEEWGAFYKQLGAPEKGEAYGFKAEEGHDPEFLKEASETFAKFGLRPEQAKGLVDWWNEKAGGMTKAQQEQAAKAETDRLAALDNKNKEEDSKLRNDWGQSYDANLNQAKQAVRQFFGEKAQDIIGAIEEKVGYGATMRIMQAIGKGLGEGKELGLQSTPTGQAQGGGLEAAFKESLAKAGLK